MSRWFDPLQVIVLIISAMFLGWHFYTAHEREARRHELAKADWRACVAAGLPGTLEQCEAKLKACFRVGDMIGDYGQELTGAQVIDYGPPGVAKDFVWYKKVPNGRGDDAGSSRCLEVRTEGMPAVIKAACSPVYFE